VHIKLQFQLTLVWFSIVCLHRSTNIYKSFYTSCFKILYVSTSVQAYDTEPNQG